ncbi:MAG: hypothetical protein CSB49_00780 [Proteobacteria bacterium]|nr:MAG: hypothetical protein CSB49_00780 [Pseudomonadota bacterium]
MSSSTLRIVLTVVISIGILLVWNHFFGSKTKAPQQGKAPVRKTAKAPGTSSKVAPKPKIGAEAGTGSGAVKGDTVGPVTLDREGKQTTLIWKAGKAKVTFTDRQGALRHVVLANDRYKELRAGKLQQIDLVQTVAGKGPWPLEAAFPDSDFVVPKNARYKLVKRTRDSLVYEWSSSKVRIRKSYKLDDKRPVMRLSVEVQNLSKNMLDARLKMKLFAQQDPASSQPGMTNPYPKLPTGLCYVNGKLERRSSGAIAGTQSSCSAAGCGMGSGPVNKVGQVNWIASDDRYFITALVPKDAGAQRRCELSLLASNPHIVEVALTFKQTKLKVGESKTHEFLVFLGAKELEKLDTILGGDKKSLELSKSIEFGWFAVICRPMLWLLKQFYRVVGNWGIAIILLTLVVKLLTFYWTHKSMKSMRNMQRLKPKMDLLKEKFGDDKARLNQEMMNLYKVHKVNPLGGCLPMVIQMPIWFALYRTLGNAQELYRSPFFGWISDLTAPDPYYILPIAMGLSMFAQQAITPQPMEGTQAKIMKYFMPGMFTFMMLWLPAGLTLYIFVNTLLTMVHQWQMNRSDPLPSKEEAQQEAQARSGSGGGSGALHNTPTTKARAEGGTSSSKASSISSARGGRGARKRRRKKKPTSSS